MQESVNKAMDAMTATVPGTAERGRIENKIQPGWRRPRRRRGHLPRSGHGRAEVGHAQPPKPTRRSTRCGPSSGLELPGGSTAPPTERHRPASGHADAPGQVGCVAAALSDECSAFTGRSPSSRQPQVSSWTSRGSRRRTPAPRSSRLQPARSRSQCPLHEPCAFKAGAEPARRPSVSKHVAHGVRRPGSSGRPNRLTADPGVGRTKLPAWVAEEAPGCCGSRNCSTTMVTFLHQLAAHNRRDVDGPVARRSCCLPPDPAEEESRG